MLKLQLIGRILPPNRNDIALAANSLQPIELSLPTSSIEGAAHVEADNKAYKARCDDCENVPKSHDNYRPLNSQIIPDSREGANAN
jgi:hypothetical protein